MPYEPVQCDGSVQFTINPDILRMLNPTSLPLRKSSSCPATILSPSTFTLQELFFASFSFWAELVDHPITFSSFMVWRTRTLPSLDLATTGRPSTHIAYSRLKVWLRHVFHVFDPFFIFPSFLPGLARYQFPIIKFLSSPRTVHMTSFLLIFFLLITSNHIKSNSKNLTWLIYPPYPISKYVRAFPIPRRSLELYIRNDP